MHELDEATGKVEPLLAVGGRAPCMVDYKGIPNGRAIAVSALNVCI